MSSVCIKSPRRAVAASIFRVLHLIPFPGSSGDAARYPMLATDANTSLDGPWPSALTHSSDWQAEGEESFLHSSMPNLTNNVVSHVGSTVQSTPSSLQFALGHPSPLSTVSKPVRQSTSSLDIQSVQNSTSRLSRQSSSHGTTTHSSQLDTNHTQINRRGRAKAVSPSPLCAPLISF